MYRFLLIFCTLGIIGEFTFAQNDKTTQNKIEIKLNSTNMEKVRPSQINKDDVEELLSILGLKLKQEQYRKQKYQDEMLVKGLEHFNTVKSKTIAGTQLKNFPAEALVFYSAIGASMYRQSVTDAAFKGGRLDPIWVQNLLHEMTSPIGVFSFLAFVLVSGQTNVLYSRWLSHKKPFTKGIFKGKYFIHKSVMTPHKVQSSLSVLRRKAFLDQGMLSNTLKYQGTRAGVNLMAKAGGIIGMGTGMMASNIIHELDYMFSSNINYKGCFKSHSNKAENQALFCDLFWDQLKNTTHNWGPELISLVSASFISHWLVSAGYSVGHRLKFPLGVNKLRITGRFLNGSVIKKVMITPLLKAGVMVGTLLNPIKKIKWSKTFLKYFFPNNFLFRFINLYMFMEMSTLLTDTVVDKLWTENISAKNISNSLEDFTQYQGMFNQGIAEEKLLNCDNSDNTKCKYHDSVFSAYKTGTAFTSWRQYKMQYALQAGNNWFQYISSAMGSYNLTYAIYKELFKAKQKQGLLYPVSYFGKLTTPQDKEYVFLSNNKAVKDIFTSLITDINKFIKRKKIRKPLNLNLEVVSLSQSHFIKPDIKNNAINQVFILKALFSAIDAKVPVNTFYGNNFDKAFFQETQKIYQSYKNLDINGVYKIAIDNLRKKVLAAGVEYLIYSGILNTSRRSRKRNSNVYSSLFYNLYKKAESIKPHTQGMDIVQVLNAEYLQKSITTSVDFHSSHVGVVYTPRIIDFILVSAVCGPSLNAHNKNIQKIDHILNNQNKDNILKNKDTILNQIPVFDTSLMNTSYQFYPPQIPYINLDSQTKKSICFSINKPITLKKGFNIYNTSYEVKGKHYSNLLHLILDHIDGEETDFESWWAQTYMDKYMYIFMGIADLEYQKVVENNFITPLFTKDVKQVLTDEEFSFLPKFSEHNVGKHVVPVGVLSEVNKQFPLNIPRGVFSNIYFELQYWSDIIIYFSQKIHTVNQKDITVVESNLQKFIEAFKSPETCSTIERDSQIQNCYQQWIENFLNPEFFKSLNNILNQDIAVTLGIDSRVLFNNAFPQWDINNQTRKEFENLSPEHIISAFAQDAKNIPFSLVQFSVIRLKQLLDETQEYAQYALKLTQHPQVKSVIDIN